jgi:ProP effector
MVENARPLDLSGQAAGVVTAAQAIHAKQQASRQRSQVRRIGWKAQARPVEPVADTQWKKRRLNKARRRNVALTTRID